MYEEFFGLNGRPFSLTPNPRFVFYSSRYRDAEDGLLYGIARKEGFMVLTGAPGTGKTTLCRDLLRKLDRDKHRSALLFNPFLSGTEMLQALLTEFDVPFSPTAQRADLHNILNQFLLDQLREGRVCVAIFDEAQHLSSEFLEQIRVLSNLETADEKLIQIVLVGQPELLARISAPGMSQLNQRVSVKCRLAHLNQDETKRYIQHRLEVAGARGRVEFTGRGMKRVYKASHGIPRRINAICDQGMLAAYVEQTRRIEVRHVDQAIKSLSGDEADHAAVQTPFWKKLFSTASVGVL
ncbi:MAG: AAA family ATPase [Gemmatimonadaceae bacterium]|nr:AAA family ATPase [Gemmatimonadaceae bacterium]